MALLEICVDSDAGLMAAIEGGADRIELCSALSVGGLSPSLALLEAATASPIPVYAMIRPRAGDFLFSDAEISGMEKEIAQVRAMGLAGVVLGVGSEDGLDFAALSRLCQAAHGLGKTLHRVVDLLDDPLPQLASVHALGFERILSSGGGLTAMEGLELLSVMAQHAPDSLSIMPGSGVTPDNASHLLAATGATEIHASASQFQPLISTRLVDLGFAPAQAKATDTNTVRALKSCCQTG